MTETVYAPEALAAPAAEVPANAPANAHGRKDQRRPRTAQAAPQRTVHPVLQRLFELYPAMFGARFLPLKLGVYQELLALHPDEFKKEDLKVALGLHARSTRYLESVAAGHARHDLQGAPVEPVAPEHVLHAVLEVYRRRQARSKDDLKPWLQQRLVAAIEASGLARQDYLDRVQVNDEWVQGALDAAFATLASQAARREAMQRAFAASGCSEAEFADMYGLDLATVQAWRPATAPAA